MPFRSHPRRHHLRHLWTGGREPPSTTDDIPRKADPIKPRLEPRPQLARRASDPFSQYMSPQPTLSSLATVLPDDSMQSEATITFTQPGVQPPVYVVTSLSSPPWTTLELKPSEDKTPSGDFVFEQKFANVKEGSYQYKIRIGEGHWVVDESKESGVYWRAYLCSEAC